MKDNEVLVKVEGVSKKFCRNLKRSLWYGVKDISSELFGVSSKGELRKDEFWAVNDVSFELRRGECLGLIGHNGAGKSTLLKMLNGLIKPDKGKITMKGRIGALIELGAGFNPILTGRENIYNNGAVLGFSKKEIDKKFDAIVDFAEIGDFIDTPVQNYSSGMKVRLGFAVAAQMEPDVLIIDEVLAVGDVGFRIKCLNTISQLVRKTTVIFVSHSMPQIARICTDVLMLKTGNTLFHGSVGEGVEKYFNVFDDEKMTVIGDDIKMLNCEIWSNGKRIDSEGSTEAALEHNKDIITKIKFTSKKDISALKVSQTYFDKEMKPLAVSYFTLNNIKKDDVAIYEIINANNQFAPGIYSVSYIFYDISTDSRVETLANYRSIRKFRVTGKQDISHAPFLFNSTWKSINQNL